MKQVIILRDDIDMSRGKAVAQGSHVSVLATQEADDTVVDQWIENGGKKITLKVDSEEELIDIISQVNDLPKAKIRDLGYTELEANTLTAGAIGPAGEDEIDDHTGDLSLYD